jgi:hypothetical protein
MSKKKKKKKIASPEEPAEGPKNKQEKLVRCEEGGTCDA